MSRADPYVHLMTEAPRGRGRPPKPSLRVEALEVPDVRPGIARRLRERRDEKGLTQHEVAALSGLTQTAIREIEAGRSDPKCSTISALAMALACPAGWLAFGG